MEHDLSLVLTEALYKLYGLKDEFGTMNTLYKYLHIRYSVSQGNKGSKTSIKKATNRDIVNFILDELNIDVFTDNLKPAYVIYKDNEYNISIHGEEFTEDLEFRANLEGDINYNIIMDEIYKKGYVKSIKYRGLREHKDYIKYNRLIALNETFGITPTYSAGVEGFVTSHNHNPYKRSLEEILEATLSSSKSLGSYTTTHITEEQLEDYLIKNLELIEEGLVFLGRQIEIPGGKVDIVARDSNENICVIEIKINEDKSIIWQAMHYPKEINKKYCGDKIRMITIAPSYSEHILAALIKVDNVEIFDYKIKVSMGNIESLNINKI